MKYSQAQAEARANDVAEMETLAKLDELTAEQEARFNELEANIAKIDAAARRSAAADEARGSQPDTGIDLRHVAKPETDPVPVLRSVDPYAEGSDHQFFGDMVAARKGSKDAHERLQRHFEATGDVESARQLRTYSSTTESEGGYLVAPVALQSGFMELLAAGRPTANLVTRVPIDSGVLQYTDTVNIPTQTGATAVAAHTENAALTETTATFGTVAVAIARRGGKATVPNFLMDRSMPGADQIILKDLAKRAGVDVDQFVLNNTGTNAKGFFQETGLGGATYTAGTATLAGLWPVLLNAIQDVSAGIFDMPDAIVMHTRRWFWMLAQLDASNRPYIGALMPQNAMGDGGVAAPAGFGAGVAPAGHILGIPVYLDNSIATTYGDGTDEDRILVGKMDEAWLLETTPKFAVSKDALMGTDQTLLKVTYDVGFSCARRKAAFSVVSGTGLNDVN